MHLPFSLRGIAGDVDIKLEITRNPEVLGAMPEAIGLPHCHAAVDYQGLGYAGMLGWVQLVRSTDNNSGGERFEMDPFLCYLKDDDQDVRIVQAITGFSWGFTITAAATTVTPARPLSSK